ncbi:tyrosine-type recombinase/integrase [Desulfosudis oleivorans]|uniref:Integrase family protein n=1 Tax=Desulfosudis oleivorans (strain DSM 6200 / JCM 39069 / Hxd3) TaxID=96561 RepID=A8ZXF8_DESOH|nr:tyrosine-type recombinase/integrase [Desulfosudis oleivorans]ABW68537.1 integrase family protein [Desulfosudis oleivorans Hxd3]
MSIWKTKWGYRAEFMHRGKRILAKGFFKYKDEARQWIKKEKEIAKNRQRYSSPDNLSLWYLAQKYLADCKLNYSQKTFDEKEFCLTRFYNAVGDIDVTEIQPYTILDFINDRAIQQSNNAANKDRKNLKAFYSWLRDYYNILYDPVAVVRKKSHTTKTRRIIPIQDILKIIEAAEGQDRVMIEAYWHTGARKSEIFRWKWAEDINFEERWVRLGTRKSRDRAMSYEKLWMNDDLYQQLSWQWDNRFPDSPYVFCNLDERSEHYGKPYVSRQRFIKGLCKTAEVLTFNYHDLRHTVAKYLNDLQNVPLKKVQQVLRHQKQTTTEIYVAGNYTNTREVMSLLEIKELKKHEKNSLSFSLSGKPKAA